MDFKRGKGPETVSRPISVVLARQELLDLMTNYIRKKVSTAIELNTMVGMGAGNVLESITFTGTETVPLIWDKPNSPTITPTTPPAPGDNQGKDISDAPHSVS